MVADLLNAENRWDSEKLKQHFMAEDVELILRIPLARRQMKDEVMWGLDKRGEYSVKSAYQLALRLKFPDEPSSSASSSSQWKTLWALELPEKVKIFIWKASKNILPTAENLWRRKCIQEPVCQSCKRCMETVRHVLFECKATRKIWNLAPFTFQPINAPSQDNLSIIQEK